MRDHASIMALAFSLLFSATASGATVYDQTIVDGVRQAREGNPVVPPLSFVAHFANTPTPIGDGTLEIVASGDFDASSEFLNIFADGVFIDTAFQVAGFEVPVSRTLSIQLSTLAFAAADSAIDISLVGTSGGGANVNILTVNSVRLTYSAVPLPATGVLLPGALVTFLGVRRRSSCAMTA